MLALTADFAARGILIVRACDVERARGVCGLVARAATLVVRDREAFVGDVLWLDFELTGAAGDISDCVNPGILLRQSTSRPEVLESGVDFDFVAVVLSLGEW